MNIVAAVDLSKSYSLLSEKDTRVLHSVSISIEKGEFVAIVGPSGAGKSTLLHILGTLDTADSGVVELSLASGSYRLSELSATKLSELRNRHIGFIFQFHQLLPEFSARENVMMPALIAGAATASAAKKAADLLSLVGLGHRHEHKPQEMSGGEQQRVAIARALINDPEILFADEPTGNLDSANTTAILELLSSIRQQRSLTMVIATHSLDIAQASQRVVRMRDGRIE